MRAVAAKPIRIDDSGCEETLTNADERPASLTSSTIRSSAGGSIARRSVQRPIDGRSGLNHRHATCEISKEGEDFRAAALALEHPNPLQPGVASWSQRDGHTHA